MATSSSPEQGTAGAPKHVELPSRGNAAEEPEHEGPPPDSLRSRLSIPPHHREPIRIEPAKLSLAPGWEVYIDDEFVGWMIPADEPECSGWWAYAGKPPPRHWEPVGSADGERFEDAIAKILRASPLLE